MSEQEKRFIDLDVEDITSGNSIERIVYAIMVIVFVLVISVILYIGLVAATPFKPYEFYAYDPIPQEVCPEESVDVYAYRSVDQNYTIESIEIEGYWYSEEEGLVGDVSGYADPTVIRNPIRSVAFRSAPSIEGEWYPSTTVIVRGSVYGWDKEQREEYRGTTPVVVKEDGC